MPQGRRKVPFSGKAKKLQLQEKKHRKGIHTFVTGDRNDNEECHSESRVLKVNNQPSHSSRNKSSRYALKFFRETDDEIRKRKEEAYLPLSSVKESPEISVDSSYNEDLDFPKRPPWNYDMSPQEVDVQEQRYFTEYVSKLEKQFESLSYFELNLETWRQLWRVLEMSDIVLFIVDIRFPASMFPPSLYNFVTASENKYLILVLNKIDLAPPSLVVAWKTYFTEKFPSLHVLMFTSFPGYNLRCNPQKKSGLKVVRQKGRLHMAAEGAQKLFDVCKEIVEDQVDLSSWQEKIIEEMKEESDNDILDVAEFIHVKSTSNERFAHEKFQDGILTIGCLGHPNAGKSSLLNAIMGKKVVSVSRTPGHTKHFQTIFLTPKVKLCDCPGLVFPSTTPKTLQVLMGSFPIAQLREPYSSIKFLAEHMDLIKLLSLIHPDGDKEWSAVDICNAWAQKRGFYTARAARLDTYRAANHLLRMALEGKICLCLHPPGFSKTRDIWENHKDTQMVKWIQAQGRFLSDESNDDADTSEDDGDSASDTQQESNIQSHKIVEDDNDSDDNNDDKLVSLNKNKFSVLDSVE